MICLLVFCQILFFSFLYILQDRVVQKQYNMSQKYNFELFSSYIKNKNKQIKICHEQLDVYNLHLFICFNLHSYVYVCLYLKEIYI